MKRIVLLSFVFALALALPVQAKIRVFACEPEWGALLDELAGDGVDTYVATSALQDVHAIEARPSLIARVRRADLLVCSGADLEIGWLPALVKQAGNSRLTGGPGVFMATEQVLTLERPSQLDRAAGDVHPQGNPHVQLDPYRVAAIAKALAARLGELDPDNQATYGKRLADFSARWQAAIPRWEEKAAGLRGRKVVVHHASWVYLLSWLGIEQVGALEPKPGVPPTSAHLAGLIDNARNEQAFAILLAAYQDPKAARWLSARTDIPVVVLPFTVGGDAQARDLFGLFDSTLDKLLAVAK